MTYGCLKAQTKDKKVKQTPIIHIKLGSPYGSNIPALIESVLDVLVCGTAEWPYAVIMRRQSPSQLAQVCEICTYGLCPKNTPT